MWPLHFSFFHFPSPNLKTWLCPSILWFKISFPSLQLQIIGRWLYLYWFVWRYYSLLHNFQVSTIKKFLWQMHQTNFLKSWFLCLSLFVSWGAVSTWGKNSLFYENFSYFTQKFTGRIFSPRFFSPAGTFESAFWKDVLHVYFWLITSSWIQGDSNQKMYLRFSVRKLSVKLHLKIYFL